VKHLLSGIPIFFGPNSFRQAQNLAAESRAVI
jgi:hypothetical protein